tara:strand:+ start:22608 stop:23015 length:408 start_codon:yes stop_codon:yes gene_type:complete
MKMNLNQITLPCTNVQQSVDFYKRMGFNLIVLSDHYARFESSLGEATFSLHLAPQAMASQSVVIYFEVESVPDAVLELKNLGFEILQETRDQPWLWTEAYIQDPGGNRVCVYHAGENRKNPPWRINSSANGLEEY